MDCVKKNCNISGEDRMVSCWLCLGLCHLKCCGLRARDADALGDKSKFLQWTCPNCRPISIEFYKFFKSYKSEFDGIKADFLALKCKLDRYGELFSMFPTLDAISPKPKQKRTTKHSTSSPGTSKASIDPKVVATAPSASDLNIISSQNHTVIPPPTTTSPKESQQSDQNAITLTTASSHISANCSSSIKSPISSNIPSHLQINSAPILSTVFNPLNNNQPPELMVFSPLLSSNTDPINNTSILQKGNPSVTEPKPLRVIPPMKTIFATRFAPDTSVLDVEFYIKNNLKQDFYNNIKIFEINARNRASFKIIVPEDLFDHLVNTKFWPKNTIIKQFVYRNNDNVTLPSATKSVSKN